MPTAATPAGDALPASLLTLANDFQAGQFPEHAGQLATLHPAGGAGRSGHDAELGGLLSSLRAGPQATTLLVGIDERLYPEVPRSKRRGLRRGRHQAAPDASGAFSRHIVELVNAKATRSSHPGQGSAASYGGY